MMVKLNTPLPPPPPPPPLYFAGRRDPWTRLCSGFRSKLHGACKMDLHCFKHYVPHVTNATINAATDADLLKIYFEAILDPKLMGPASKYSLNEHFQLQSKQCLSPHTATMELVPQQVDVQPNLEAFSEMYGHTGNRSFHHMMGRQYVWGGLATGEAHGDEEKHCYRIAAHLLQRVVRFLADDYSVIEKRTGVVYQSKKMLDAALLRATAGNSANDVVVCVMNSTIAHDVVLVGGGGPRPSPPAPPAPPGSPGSCTFASDTCGFGSDAWKKRGVATKEACCALCVADPKCTAAVYTRKRDCHGKEKETNAGKHCKGDWTCRARQPTNPDAMAGVVDESHG